MPKPTKKEPLPGQKELDKLDLDPHAWPRFEKLIREAAKQGHKPHEQKKPKASARRRKGK